MKTREIRRLACALAALLAILVPGCARHHVETVEGGWLGAGSATHYHLGNWDSDGIGKVYRTAGGERLLIGDLLWREKASSEEEVRDAYAAWHVTRRTSEPLRLQGSQEALAGVLPFKHDELTALRVEAKGRRAEMLTDLMQLQALLGEPEFPDTRIEALKEQIRKDPGGEFEVCFLREWCDDLVIEATFKRGTPAPMVRALEEELSRTITGRGGARERFTNYNENERVLRLEYTGRVLLRRRHIQLKVEKDRRIILGPVTSPSL